MADYEYPDKLDLDGTEPAGTRLAWVTNRGEVVIPGRPIEGDGHNCDAMGCPSVGWHIVERGRMTRG